MTKSIVQFLLTLSVILVLSLFLHLLVLNTIELPLFNNKIIACYLFNYIVAVFTYLGLVIFKDKLLSSLGFIFMAGSMIKFGLFFLIFYPIYNQDGNIEKLEFATFFIPYAVSLIIEVFFLVKTLNK